MKIYRSSGLWYTILSKKYQLVAIPAVATFLNKVAPKHFVVAKFGGLILFENPYSLFFPGLRQVPATNPCVDI